MKRWQLEVARMFLYMAFPVGLFHLFNQPEFFEKQVIETKSQWYPPEYSEDKSKIREEIDNIIKKRELRKLEELKEQQRKFESRS